MARGQLMRVLSDVGQRLVVVPVGSQAASLIGAHWNAIKLFRDTGDPSLLARFVDVTVVADTRSGFATIVRFATDLGMIRRWAAQGEIDDEGPYPEER